MAKISQEDYQKRIDRLTEIFSDIVSHADDSARTRCPYRDRFDRCTAAFRCRNQTVPAEEGAAAGCAHDGTFDYRQAWESDPAHHGRAKKKLADVKRDAAERRKDGARKPRG